jgi:hypothetical protein
MIEINAKAHAMHEETRRQHAARIERNLVRDMTAPDGSLEFTEGDHPNGKEGRSVDWNVGEKEVLLSGWFSAENLRAIADHIDDHQGEPGK